MKKSLASGRKCDILHLGVFLGAEFKNCRIQTLFPQEWAQNPRCLPKNVFFLYNSKCIDFKSHKCIKVEYKVGHYGRFGTKYMLVSITVLEIQHVGAFTDLLK